MALINNSAQLAMECALDKIGINYDGYYQGKCFFMGPKLSGKKCCIHTKYGQLKDINNHRFTHKITYTIENSKFDNEELYCFVCTHKNRPDEIRFSILFTGKEIKSLISKINQIRGKKADYINIFIDRRPYLYLGKNNYLDITDYLCVRRLDMLREKYMNVMYINKEFIYS